jgi:hypothetical protein
VGSVPAARHHRHRHAAAGDPGGLQPGLPRRAVLHAVPGARRPVRRPQPDHRLEPGAEARRKNFRRRPHCGA